MDQETKKYQSMDAEIVLFNEEYYLTVIRLDISPLNPAEKEAFFTHLYGFESKDVEMEIDVSEEQDGVWYLQLLVPHVLTLPEAARKRLERGKEQLTSHLQKQPVKPAQKLLAGDEIYVYVKRYNPNLKVIS